MAHDVFLSFSSKDQQIADSVYKYLADHNIGCWYSKTNIVGGGRYYKDIVNAVNDSKCLLLIYSYSALQSRHINTEVDMAFSKGKVIIPYQIENVPLNDDFEYFLRSFQFVPAFSPDENEALKLQRLLESVIKNLETLNKMDKSHISTALPASTESQAFTAKEQKYLNELRKALGDGQISEEEKRKLIKAAEYLGILSDRASELEEVIKIELGFSKPSLSEDEQKYVNELKKAFEDGQLSKEEEEDLQLAAELSELSTERAEELKEWVKKELGLILRQSETLIEAPSEEVDYDERYNNRDIAYKLAEELNQKYSEQLGKLRVEFVVYQSHQAESACVYCYFPVGDLGFKLEAWVASKEIGMLAHGSNQASRDFGKKWFETNCNSLNARIYAEDGYFLELWKVEFTNKTDRAFREKQFKDKVFESLDIVLPEIAKTSLELGAQVAPEDPETESKVRGMVESILNDLTSKYSDSLTKLNTSFQNWGNSSIAINLPLVKPICFCFQYKHSDDLIFLFTSGQKRYTLTWFNENLANEFPEPHYWEGDPDPIFWEIKFKKEDNWESREQMFKNKIIESLDIILPKAVSSMEFLNSITAFIDDIVAELSKVFPAEEGWEYSQNAKDMQRYCGIYFFKTNWKQDGLERGIISYGIECDSSGFDNLFWGIPKGSDQYSIDPAKEQLLVSKITALVGEGETSPWWPYYKFFDNPHRYINDILNNREGFLTRIRDDFSKMKRDVTPLVDDIINTGPK